MIPKTRDKIKVMYSMTRNPEDMTLRDYFAGQALNGASAWDMEEDEIEYIAEKCYKIADAMMKKRGGDENY